MAEFLSGSNSTPWEHLLYKEEKNHGEFKTATKVYNECILYLGNMMIILYILEEYKKKKHMFM